MNSQYVYQMQLMGTTITLILFAKNTRLVQAVFSSLKKIEAMLTVNSTESVIMSINQAAGSHPVRVNQLVFDLISYAKQASLLPNSMFNFTIGALVKLWKIGFTGQHVPNARHIQACLSLVDPNYVELNAKEHTVFLKKPNMAIDLGAIAKGYAADVVNIIFDKYNVKSAMVNLGGNVLAKGYSLSTTDNYWHIGLQKPFARHGELLGIIKIINKSVVTSGIYERFFVMHQQHYHHILNPKTGYPLNNELESITIISDSSIIGDIYSTVIYGLGLNKGLNYLSHRHSLAAIFVTKNKKIIVSDKHTITFTKLDENYSLWYFDNKQNQIKPYFNKLKEE